MQRVKLYPNEFVSLLCNSEDRQQLIERLHDPELHSTKEFIGRDLELSDCNLREKIYSLNRKKTHFVDKLPSVAILDHLNAKFLRRLGADDPNAFILGNST